MSWNLKQKRSLDSHKAVCLIPTGLQEMRFVERVASSETTMQSDVMYRHALEGEESMGLSHKVV